MSAWPHRTRPLQYTTVLHSQYLHVPVDCVAPEHEGLAHAGELRLLEQDTGLCSGGGKREVVGKEGTETGKTDGSPRN
jgi:hypothetical protein